MKILIFVSKLSGGGAERAASLWANGFVERGYRVGLVVNCRQNMITYPFSDKVALFSVYCLLRQLLKKFLHVNISFVPGIRKIIGEFQPDVIIGVMHPWAEFAYRASKGMNIPIINTEHNSFERSIDYPLNESEWKGKWLWNKHFDYITVLTKADKKIIKDRFKNVSVLPNPLAYTPVESIPSKQKIILAVGRLDVWHVKGFDVLIDAWAKIACTFPDWKLQIAGGGSEKSKESLIDMIKDNNIDDRVEFLGFRNNLQPYYQKASIFVLSSRYEGFGMSLIEAMSQGCASIACDFNGRQREIITSEDEGIICPTDNKEVLAEAIRGLIVSDLLRKRLQENAVERAKYYCLNNIMNYWDEILSKVNEKISKEVS